MIALVRRFQLLSVLMLLLSGLLQTAAAAQGAVCGRARGNAGVAVQIAIDPGDAVGQTGSPVDRVSFTDAHDHSTGLPSDGPVAPAAGCGIVAFPGSYRAPSFAVETPHVRPAGDLPPGSLLIRSLFRPPRLS